MTIITSQPHYWHVDGIPNQTIRNVGKFRIISNNFSEVGKTGQNIERYIFVNRTLDYPYQAEASQGNYCTDDFPAHAYAT